MKFMTIFTIWIHTTLLRAAESSYDSQNITEKSPKYTKDLGSALDPLICQILSSNYDPPANEEGTLVKIALKNYKDDLSSSPHKTDRQKVTDLLNILSNGHFFKRDKNLEIIISGLFCNLFIDLEQKIALPTSNNRYAATLLAALKPYFKYLGNGTFTYEELVGFLPGFKELIKNNYPASENGFVAALVAALDILSETSSNPRKSQS